MAYVYRGYLKHKNPATGKKLYKPVIKLPAGADHYSRRWFLRVRDAHLYGTRWARRCSHLQAKAAAE